MSTILSDNQKCKTCKWFLPKVLDDARKAYLGFTEMKGDLYDVGYCCHHSPSMQGFPIMFVNNWCGDHRLDENKFRAA